jgi:hypothetical protein
VEEPPSPHRLQLALAGPLAARMLSTSSKMLDSSPRLGGAKSVPRDFWMLRKMCSGN